MVPDQHTLTQSKYLSMAAFGLILFLFCNGQGWSLAVNILCFCLHIMFVEKVIYLRPLNVEEVSIDLVMLVAYASMVLSLVMLLGYVRQLHGTLSKALKTNISLLNSMQEGVVILDKESGEVLFCNSPAKRLLLTYLGGKQTSTV